MVQQRRQPPPGGRTGRPVAVIGAAIAVIVVAGLVGWLVLGTSDDDGSAVGSPAATASPTVIAGAAASATIGPTTTSTAEVAETGDASPETTEAAGTEAATEEADIPTATMDVDRTPTAPPEGPPPAIGDFGELPAADIPTGSSFSRPFSFSYRLDMSLQAVPAEAPVYQLEPRSWTIDEVQALATSLGITGEAIDQGGNTYQVTDGGELYISGNVIQYVAPRGTTGGELAGNAALAQAARAWLLEHDIVGANVGDGVVTDRSEDVGQATVVVKPLEPSPILSLVPSASITVQGDGTVVEATIRWPGGMTPSVYGLERADQLWSTVQAGQGYVEIDPTLLPGSSGQVTGTITLTGADLAYTTAGSGADQYLVPLVAFSGQAAIDGANGPVPVTVYVAAVGAQAGPRG